MSDLDALLAFSRLPWVRATPESMPPHGTDFLALTADGPGYGGGFTLGTCVESSGAIQYWYFGGPLLDPENIVLDWWAPLPKQWAFRDELERMHKEVSASLPTTPGPSCGGEEA